MVIQLSLEGIAMLAVTESPGKSETPKTAVSAVLRASLKGRISIIFIFCSIKGGGSLTLHSLARKSDFIQKTQKFFENF